MDEIQMQRTQNQPKSKSKIKPFLSYFGFSRKTPEKNIPENDDTKKHSRPYWFSWSRSRLKKSTSSKTVPIDGSIVSEKPIYQLDKKIRQSKKDKSKYDDINDLVLAVVRVSDQTQQAKHQDQEDTGKKAKSISRKIEAIRTGSSKPGSPESRKTKEEPKPLTRQYRAEGQNQNYGYGSKRRHNNKKEGQPLKYLEPIVGLLVILVTLLIMMLWGRLCAILCTSACFYFVPKLRINGMTSSSDIIGIGSSNSEANYLDLDMDMNMMMNTKEYNNKKIKKVVLEGFLQRSSKR